MKYRAIAHFKDKQDNNHEYQAGDFFPRAGKSVSQSRIDQLLGANNVRGKAVIEAITEKVVKPDTVKEPEKVETIERPLEEVQEKPKRGRKKANADK